MPAKQSFPEMENKVLHFWKEEKIFQKSLEVRQHGPRFSFYDGPPFATGLPHYGHILAMTIKDIVTRYQTMKGKYVPRRNGWDCHGLPVEYELEKELGIKNKTEIEKYGVDKFNAKAREIVLRYVDEWTSTITRMGRWIDTENAYTTMSNDYIESVWWVFKQIWEKGLVYRDDRVSPYCPRCGTGLSNFEMTQGYREITESSIFLKFKILNNGDYQNSYFLVWTTTPWTLPGNIALAVNEAMAYVKIKLQSESEKDEFLILAKDRLMVIKEKYEIVKELSGKDLIGLKYESLYPKAADLLTKKDHIYEVYGGDFVTSEEGTGIVHIAPSFGEDDMNLAKKHQLPALKTVNEAGKVIAGVAIPGEGKWVKDADEDIKNDLKTRQILFQEEEITHPYPFCWRCDTPLLYYALPSWYIAVSKVKAQLIKNNTDIRWVPAHIKIGRFGKWLEGAKDWAISRQRYWGAPMPIWICGQCHEMKVIGSKDELKLKPDFDLHKPQIDDVKLPCDHCAGEMKRVPEVFDCWFESGSMPYAQWHYPFENKSEFESGFPADFIGEGIDQTRGWFYTMHVIATLLYDKPAYKNVVVNGLILAQDGRKLSKRLKNYLEPEKLFSSVGVDALRYFLMASAPIGEDYRFSEEVVREQVRKYLLPLWNSFIFLATYGPINNWQPGEEGEPTMIDKWMASRTNLAAENFEKYMNRYELTKAARVMGELVTDISTWYIRRSRKRQDKAFFNTLYNTLMTQIKLTAPFTPFIAEEIYQHLKENDMPISVHLTDLPKASSPIDKELLSQMVLGRKIVEIGHAARAEAGIKVRQPLAEIAWKIDKGDLSAEIEQIILDELNIKTKSANLETLRKSKSMIEKNQHGITVVLNYELSAELLEEGIIREIIRHIQALRKEMGCQPGEQIKLGYRVEGEKLAKIWEGAQANLEKETDTQINQIGTETGDVTQQFDLADGKVTIMIRK